MKSKRLNATLLAILMILFGGLGCVSAPNTIENTVELSSEIKFTLTAPPVGLLSKTQTHLIETTFNGKTQQFITQAEYTDKQISLAAISVSGLPLFDFIWHEDKPLIVNQYVPLPSLDINYIIADLQWVNWPFVQLKRALIGTNIQVVEEQSREVSNEGSRGWLRLVKQHNIVVLKIEKTDERYHLENIQRKYSLDITDLSKEK